MCARGVLVRQEKWRLYNILEFSCKDVPIKKN